MGSKPFLRDEKKILCFNVHWCQSVEFLMIFSGLLSSNQFDNNEQFQLPLPFYTGSPESIRSKALLT